MVRTIVLVILIISILLMSMGFIVAGQAIGVAAIVTIGLAWAGWLVMEGQRWTWTPTALAALFILAGAVALLLSEQALVWVYLGVVGALATWDLSLFLGRLLGCGQVVAISDMVADHLLRLGLSVLVALVGLSAYQLVEMSFHFERALFFAALLILGSSILARWLLRDSD